MNKFKSLILLSILAASSVFGVETLTKVRTKGTLLDSQNMQFMPGAGLTTGNKFLPLIVDANGVVQTTSTDSGYSPISTQTKVPSTASVMIDTGDGIGIRSAPLAGITSGGVFVPLAVDGSGKLMTSGGGGSDPAIGGNITGGTNNSVLYVNPSGKISQDAANFKYDIGAHLLYAPDINVGGGALSTGSGVVNIGALSVFAGDLNMNNGSILNAGNITGATLNAFGDTYPQVPLTVDGASGGMSADYINIQDHGSAAGSRMRMEADGTLHLNFDSAIIRPDGSAQFTTTPNVQWDSGGNFQANNVHSSNALQTDSGYIYFPNGQLTDQSGALDWNGGNGLHIESGTSNFDSNVNFNQTIDVSTVNFHSDSNYNGNSLQNVGTVYPNFIQFSGGAFLEQGYLHLDGKVDSITELDFDNNTSIDQCGGSNGICFHPNGSGPIDFAGGYLSQVGRIIDGSGNTLMKVGEGPALWSSNANSPVLSWHDTSGGGAGFQAFGSGSEVGQQSGNILTALSNYGWVTSPTLPASAITWAGNSGGIPFYNTPTTIGSTPTLGLNRVIIGGGTGGPTAAAAITANRVIVSDSSGIPVHSGTTTTEIGYVSGATSNLQTQLNSLAASPKYMSFNSNVTAIVSNQIVGYGKATTAATIIGMQGLASAFTCAVNPTFTLYDCGTSAGACTTGRTAMASVTLTAANTGTNGSVTSAALAAGHYWAIETTAGTCTGLTALGNAEYN